MPPSDQQLPLGLINRLARRIYRAMGVRDVARVFGFALQPSRALKAHGTSPPEVARVRGTSQERMP